MKKSVIAIFSVSLTAGTLYVAYSQAKAYIINKLVGSWEQELKKQSTSPSKEQISYLKEELDKLFIWEVKQLAAYSAKILAHAPEHDVSPVLDKLRAKKIFSRADLKTVADILNIGHQ